MRSLVAIIPVVVWGTTAWGQDRGPEDPLAALRQLAGSVRGTQAVPERPARGDRPRELHQVDGAVAEREVHRERPIQRQGPDRRHQFAAQPVPASQPFIGPFGSFPGRFSRNGFFSPFFPVVVIAPPGTLIAVPGPSTTTTFIPYPGLNGDLAQFHAAALNRRMRLMIEGRQRAVFRTAGLPAGSVQATPQ